MPDFGGLLARIAERFEEAGLAFMVIGGQAVLVHGEPRLTEDIDLTLAAGPGRLSEVLEVCEALALAPLPEDVKMFVERTFVLPTADRETGLRVDLIFSSTPYEAGAVARATWITVAGSRVPFASPEDLILHKLFAGRPRDLEDAQGVVRRLGSELDWAYLGQWASAFASVEGKEALPAVLEGLKAEA